MSFGDGRDKKGARKDFGPDRPTLEGLNKAAMSSSKYIVDSINKSKTVKRLIYTASIASLMPAFGEYNNRPIVDETREPDHRGGSHGYNLTKRAAEHYFAYEAAISHGRWSMITGNPADIVGPVLSPHQATETWQGKIGGIIQGIPSPQEGAGRPWMLVDVRDVAEAEIRLAESSDVESGERFLLSSSDKIYPEDIGPQVMALFPGYDSATTVAPGAGQKKVTRNHPVWQRVHLSHEKVTRAVGFNFHSFDDTLKATVKSLVDVGGIKPKMK